MTAKRLLVRAAITLVALAALGTAVIGFAHTSWGRPLLKLPLLSAMASNAGCPIGPIEPGAFEKVRVTKLKSELGDARAASHSALGFVLGQTRRPDVARWVAEKKVDCRTGFVPSVLECEKVRLADGSPEIEQLRLQFDADERLVSVDLFRSSAPPSALFARFEHVSRDLDQRVGPATASVGTPSLEYIAAKPLRTVARTYSYSDYVAKATLMNFGKRGLKLREQYQWLPS